MSHRLNFMGCLAALFGRKSAEPNQVIPAPEPETDDDVLPNAIERHEAKYQIGQILKHRLFEFRGVVFDVDPVFANTEEWYQAIPEEVRPSKDQPYYHLYAENDRTHYVAYVSEQNLTPDTSDTAVSHPDILKMFEHTANGYVLKSGQRN